MNAATGLLESRSASPRGIDEPALQARMDAILARHPCVGLAVGVVSGGRLAFFGAHGFADVATRTPIDEDTVFRIGSVTKTMTAIAVMQLQEQGLVDLDVPANDYLRAFRLVPDRARWRPATIRHLLTHTAGIPEAIHIAELLRFDWGPFEGRPLVHSVRIGERLPSLAEYYRDGLRIVAEPGMAFAYSNHGFAALGQILEDVTGTPLDRHLAAHVFAPLGMTATDLVRSERVARRLATGYSLGPGGPRPVPDRDWIGGAGGGVYSSVRDLARYAAALLAGGRAGDGALVRPDTLATMFAPQYQPDPRLASIGLAFFRTNLAGHRVVSHEGIMPGFFSDLVIAPDDDVALIALTNGTSGAMTWLPGEVEGLLLVALGIAATEAPVDVPHHAEVWPEICARYRFPARVSDLRGRVALVGGADVFVAGGRPMVRVRVPVRALYRGLPLIPDDPVDPRAFRLDLSPFGLSPVRLVFARDPESGSRVVHTELGGQPISLVERPWLGRRRLRLPRRRRVDRAR